MAEVMFETYDVPHQPETLMSKPRRGQKTHAKEHSMWRHFSGIATARTIIITNGVASASPGLVSPLADQIAAADSSTTTAGGKAVWYSTNELQTVTPAEGGIFTTAGYTVTGQYSDTYDDTYDGN